MKLITSFTLNWNLDVVDEDSHAYEGPVAECKGGTSGVHYDTLQDLYGVQADQARFLGQEAKDHVIPGYNQYLQEAQNYGSQANQEKQATQAGADSQAASTAQRQGMESNMASMGINPSDSRYASAMASMGTAAAGQQAASESGAREGVRQKGIAMEQDAVSLGMGTPTQATAAASGAGATAGTMANLDMQNRINNSRGIGSAVRGGMDLYGYLNSGNQSSGMADGGIVHMKDGGYVDREHLAMGGMAGGRGIMAQAMAAPQAPPAEGGSPGSSPMQDATMVAKGAPMVGKGISKLGSMTGSTTLQNAGNVVQHPGSTINQAPTASTYDTSLGSQQTNALASQDTGMGNNATIMDWARSKIDSMMPKMQGMEDTSAVTNTGAAGAEGLDGGLTAAEGGGEAAGAAEAAQAAEAAGTTAEAAGTATETAEAIAAAAELAAMAAADGGQIKRGIGPGAVNSTGGKAKGPGGPKDDKIPVMLSNGEFVMPVGAVRLFGLDKLEKMRQKGLQHEKSLGIGMNRGGRGLADGGQAKRPTPSRVDPQTGISEESENGWASVYMEQQRNAELDDQRERRRFDQQERGVRR